MIYGSIVTLLATSSLFQPQRRDRNRSEGFVKIIASALGCLVLQRWIPDAPWVL